MPSVVTVILVKMRKTLAIKRTVKIKNNRLAKKKQRKRWMLIQVCLCGLFHLSSSSGL